jgi:hypothetical protein
MKSRTQVILVIMNVLAWLVFVGLMIKAGAILISYGVSFKNPAGAKNLYMGWDLYNLSQSDFGHYTGMVLMTVAVVVLEAYTAYLVTSILSKIKMTKPFTMEVAKMMEKISYFILLIWVAALLHNAHASWLSKTFPGLQENLISLDFIFMGGVVFVIAQIFKRGVEIQTENELTV